MTALDLHAMPPAERERTIELAKAELRSRLRPQALAKSKMPKELFDTEIRYDVARDAHHVSFYGGSTLFVIDASQCNAVDFRERVLKDKNIFELLRHADSVHSLEPVMVPILREDRYRPPNYRFGMKPPKMYRVILELPGAQFGAGMETKQRQPYFETSFMDVARLAWESVGKSYHVVHEIPYVSELLPGGRDPRKSRASITGPEKRWLIDGAWKPGLLPQSAFWQTIARATNVRIRLVGKGKRRTIRASVSTITGAHTLDIRCSESAMTYWLVAVMTLGKNARVVSSSRHGVTIEKEPMASVTLFGGPDDDRLAH